MTATIAIERSPLPPNIREEGGGREVSEETIPYASFIGIIGAETNPIAVRDPGRFQSRRRFSERLSERFFSSERNVRLVLPSDRDVCSGKPMRQIR